MTWPLKGIAQAGRRLRESAGWMAAVGGLEGGEGGVGSSRIVVVLVVVVSVVVVVVVFVVVNMVEYDRGIDRGIR